MATIRSREISACLVLQAQSQLKALYKDNMDTIIGNCDSSLFLGGKEETTLKSWSALLGKETIDMYNTSVTKGTQESHGQNFQKLGKDLMSMDELAVMDGGKCLLQVRGVRPFLSKKYDITQHLADFLERGFLLAAEEKCAVTVARDGVRRILVDLSLIHISEPTRP